MAFSVRTVAEQAGWTIELVGEADSAVVPELQLAFDQATARSEPVVVVDLAAVSFIDSRVMSVLESWSTTLSSASRRMAVVRPTEEVMRLFRIIGLDRQFDFYPDRASALAG